MASRIAFYAIFLVVLVSADHDNTVIQNKNYNIIINLNPTDVAEELFKVMKTRLFGFRRVMNSRNILKDLENVVVPLTTASRRNSEVSIQEVATNLDHITRQILEREIPARDSFDEEILTRLAVAEMVTTLRKLARDQAHSRNDKGHDKKDTKGHLREWNMYNTKLGDDSGTHDNSFTVTVKLRKKDIYRIAESING